MTVTATRCFLKSNRPATPVTRQFSCFSYPLWNSAEGRNLPVPNEASLPGVLAELYSVIQQKKENGGEKSYTRYLSCPDRTRF
jgi:hypothetical protein